jgi:cytochrome c peroxidase
MSNHSHAARIVVLLSLIGTILLVTPYFPKSPAAYAHPTDAPATRAHFSIVNAGRATERLIRLVDPNQAHVTLTDAVTGQPITGGVELRPHNRMTFSPSTHYWQIDGLESELTQGEQLLLTLVFESGSSLEIAFDVLNQPPTEQVNFTPSGTFQITDAWVYATMQTPVNGTGGTAYDWQLPEGFPMPRVPLDNPMTAEKVELGRYLFYDVRLSGNASISCASCHLQEYAFADARAKPVGATGEVHPRNAMSLTNVAYNATLTWANPTLTELERQIVIPMFGEHPVEMGITGNEEEVLARLRTDAGYRTMFAAAFPDQPEDDRFSYRNVVAALSSFTRALISGDSPYDHFVRGDQDALSDSAKRGMQMFLSESLECHHCHTGFNMTLSTMTANSTFEERPFFNTGLYNVGGTGAYPVGGQGVYEITNQMQDMGRFRPPTLRNIALTFPYMHDGSIATLEEVVRFYADGGRNITEGENAGDGRANPYQSGFVSGFTVSDQEVADLVAFLESLTDESFITDPRFSDPFTPTAP